MCMYAKPCSGPCQTGGPTKTGMMAYLIGSKVRGNTRTIPDATNSQGLRYVSCHATHSPADASIGYLERGTYSPHCFLYCRRLRYVGARLCVFSPHQIPHQTISFMLRGALPHARVHMQGVVSRSRCAVVMADTAPSVVLLLHTSVSVGHCTSCIDSNAIYIVSCQRDHRTAILLFFRKI